MAAIPASRYNGFVKRLNLAKCNADIRAVVTFALPGFFSQPRHRADDRKLPPGESVDLIHLINANQNKRRYAPGAFFPRARYYSLVNMAADGDDFGTMRNELNAYRDPIQSGHVHILDYTNQRDPYYSAVPGIDDSGQKSLNLIMGQPNAAMTDEIVFVLYDQDKFRATVGDDSFDRFATQYAGKLLDILNREIVYFGDRNFSFPFLAAKVRWEIPKVDINNVIDLRRAETQESVCKLLRNGLTGFLQHSMDVKNFSQILPLLMVPRLGGGQLTTAFGMWAFANGFNGIIYPSARSDASVTWEGGEVAEFEGWNLIDFRRGGEDFSADQAARDFAVICNHPSLPLWLHQEITEDAGYCNHFIEKVQRLTFARGGFKMQGVHLLNQRLYGAYYANRKSPWSQTDQSLSDRDRLTLGLIRDEIEICSKLYSDQYLTSTLDERNKHLRKVEELICDLCGASMQRHDAHLLHGKLVAAINHLPEISKAMAREKGLTDEEMRAQLRERALSDPTPWAVCGACVELHLESDNEKIHSSVMAQRYFDGKTITLDDLPTTSSRC